MALISTYFVDQFTVRRDVALVVVVLPDRGYGVPWRKADEIAKRLRGLIAEAVIAGDAHDVRFDLTDRTYFFPLELAKAFRDALVAKAREAEEQEMAPQIVRDAAILARAGVPIGLSNDPKIQAEAMKEAHWNTELRRAMPGGVKSEAILGTPSVIKQEPTT